MVKGRRNTLPGKRVTVWWQDAVSFGASWSDPDEDYELIDCCTSGFLLKNEKDRVVIASTMNSIGSVGEVIAIPKAWIQRIERIK